MSLRVLLADESDTIKKVFQLALQDMQAEIKGVHSGLDVIDVALAFTPDIIFADVLLQKKNGYDICLELKQHPQLNKIPVVLMWSSFMELDQAQFKRSLANDQLEKPFDADFLRGLVRKFSPQAAANPMAQFLNFPKSLKVEAPKAPAPPPESAMEDNLSEFNSAAQPPSPPAPPSFAGGIHNRIQNEVRTETQSGLTNSGRLPPPVRTNTGSFQAPGKSLFEDLKLQAESTPQEPIAPVKIHQPPPEAPLSSDSWKSTDLSKFKLESENAKSDNLDKFEALNLSAPDDVEEVTNPGIGVIPGLNELQSQPTAPAKEQSLSGFKMPDLNLNDVLHGLTPAPSKQNTNPGISSSGLKSFDSLITPPPQSQTKTPPPVQMPTIDDSAIEAIVRAHTEEYLKTEIHSTLLEMVEKIVRDELSKVLEEEMSLKQELNSEQS